MIGKLSRCPVGGGQSSVKLSSTVVGLFVSLLQQVIYELIILTIQYIYNDVKIKNYVSMIYYVIDTGNS